MRPTIICVEISFKKIVFRHDAANTKTVSQMRDHSCASVTYNGLRNARVGVKFNSYRECRIDAHDLFSQNKI